MPLLEPLRKQESMNQLYIYLRNINQLMEFEILLEVFYYQCQSGSLEIEIRPINIINQISRTEKTKKEHQKFQR